MLCGLFSGHLRFHKCRSDYWASLSQTGVIGIPVVIFPPEALQELNVQETPPAEFAVKRGVQTEHEAAGTKNAGAVARVRTQRPPVQQGETVIPSC
jgi:ribosomal protein S3